MIDLQGKKALITGGTKGIGLATALLFKSLGAELIVCARQIDKLPEDLKASETYKIDLSNPKAVDQMISEIKSKNDSLDILVNNVGTNIRKPTLEAEKTDLDTVFNVNVKSFWMLTKGLYPLLKKSGNSSVINISSIASKTYVKTSSLIYTMSKGAVDKMTKFLAAEWGADKIRVNSIHPWYIATPLVEEVLKDKIKAEEILKRTPLSRIGTTEEVAKAIAFLASDASSYITGVDLNVDGGVSLAGLL